MIYTLSAVILIQAGLIAWLDYNNRKERKALMNAIVAKNHQEHIDLELADKTNLKPTKQEEELPDLMPTDSVPDKEYIEMITGNK